MSRSFIERDDVKPDQTISLYRVIFRCILCRCDWGRPLKVDIVYGRVYWILNWYLEHRSHWIQLQCEISKITCFITKWSLTSNSNPIYLLIYYINIFYARDYVKEYIKESNYCFCKSIIIVYLLLYYFFAKDSRDYVQECKRDIIKIMFC